MLAWPEFRIDGLSGAEYAAAPWLPVSELFGGAGEPRGGIGGGFTNAGPETLFEALSRTSVDWDGTTACPASDGSCDLSAHLLRDLGRFDSRDELFARYGQTLCGPARLLAEPVLGRRAAGLWRHVGEEDRRGAGSGGEGASTTPAGSVSPWDAGVLPASGCPRVGVAGVDIAPGRVPNVPGEDGGWADP
ncbi:hypothetical protein ACL07V_33920 [Streptomyces sp. MB22_4]|uniref:hypothetical protein n=1 Tax=Streptomyces sp. MB22_4 TaxID=3383120 RepID=UPI0039A29D2D